MPREDGIKFRPERLEPTCADDAKIEVQFIHSRFFVHRPDKLLTLLTKRYGEGGFRVEMRHNQYEIRAPGQLDWAEITADNLYREHTDIYTSTSRWNQVTNL